MKERPIIFSGPMVRAILEGRKTQTRRVVKYPLTNMAEERRLKAVISGCPYGQPGDRLWVKETWSVCGLFDNVKPSELDPRSKGGIEYKVDGKRRGKIRPSIFMPRWASRILLEITDVRVESLQDISEADAQHEGWDMSNHNVFDTYDPVTMDTAKEWFPNLWDSINAKCGYPWVSNPWVWVVTFKKI